MLSSQPAFLHGLSLLASATDARPPVPPEPLWSSLQVTLVAPPYAARPERVVQNPSGKLRVLAGTRVDLRLVPRRTFNGLSVIQTHDTDEAQAALPAESTAMQHTAETTEEPGVWTGSFVVRGAGTWRVMAGDRDIEDVTVPSFALELEPDAPPEVELSPLPRSQGDIGEREVCAHCGSIITAAP